MRRVLHILLLSLAAYLLAGVCVHAQERIIITGRVTNSGDSSNPPITDGGIHVFGYLTVAEGRDAYKAAKAAKDSFSPGVVIEERVDAQGYYEIRLPATGAILFWYEYLSDVEPQLFEVRGRHNIDCKMDLKIQLEASKVTAGDGKRLEVEPPEPEGNKLPVIANWPVPDDRPGRPDARLGLMVYVLDQNRQDTLEFRQAIVMDGKEYHDTQIRRMGYRASRDTLLGIAEKYPEFNSSVEYVRINDTVYLDPPSKRVFVEAKMWMEDYNLVYYTGGQQIIDTRRMRRPMRFLDYTLTSNDLDFNEYARRAQREYVNAESRLDIKFLVGKAQVDSRDSSSMAQLDELRRTIKGSQSEESSIKQFYIYGVASPEGNYTRNVALAGERMAYIRREVMNQMPKYVQERAYSETHSRVASWSELADSLHVDSLKREESQVRDIISRFPSSIDQQGTKIRQLPYYKTTIADHLAKLRYVDFKYVVEVFRELTPDEVVARYRNDKDYHDGKNGKEFTSYEFWILMQRLKDPGELESICKRAIRYAKLQHDDWPLPYNILAVNKIKRGEADTTLLAPFVHETLRVNYSELQMNGQWKLFNPEQIVANQVVMMLLGEHYQRAVQIAEMLRDIPKYHELRAIARCLAGYFKPGRPGAGEIYDLLHESSPRNAVVMDLAMGYWSFLDEEVERLDPEDPVTDYLKAQYVSKRALVEGEAFEFWDQKVQEQAIWDLSRAFTKDKRFVEIADGDFDMNEQLFKQALKEFEQPHSVLPENFGRAVPSTRELTEDEKVELIKKATYHPEDMTDEEWDLYFTVSGQM